MNPTKKPISHLYSIVTEKEFVNENGTQYTGYGITVYNEQQKMLYHAEDLSTDAAAVRALAKMIEAHRIAPVHIAEVIEDFCI